MIWALGWLWLDEFSIRVSAWRKTPLDVEMNALWALGLLPGRQEHDIRNIDSTGKKLTGGWHTKKSREMEKRNWSFLTRKWWKGIQENRELIEKGADEQQL